MQPIPPKVSKFVGAGCQLVIGGGFTAISLFMLIIMVIVKAPWFALLFVSLFLLFGLSMLGYGLWTLMVKPMMVGMALGPASAALSTYQVRPGESISVQYEQAARRDLDVRQVLIQLVLRERAIYRRGTNTYTAIHNEVIEQYEGPGRAVARGGVLTEGCSFRVPQTAMHSLQAPRNALIWLVMIRVDVPNTPDVTEELMFQVVPELPLGAR
jgi:energy-coupling factor transporter transmembrane protein EcfT